MSVPTLAATFVLSLALMVLLVIAGALYANRAPLFEPPGVGVRLGIYLSSNVAETSATPVLPELRSLSLTADVATALHAISQVAHELGWTQITVDRASAQLRAVVVSPVFGFRDDLVCRLTAHGAKRTELAVRSSSRVGRGDLGANAHHIMQLRAALMRRALLSGQDGG